MVWKLISSFFRCQLIWIYSCCSILHFYHTFRNYFMINLHESMGLGRDPRLAGSALRHVTDCATWPAIDNIVMINFGWFIYLSRDHRFEFPNFDVF